MCSVWMSLASQKAQTRAWAVLGPAESAHISMRVLTVQARGVRAPKAHGNQRGQQWRPGRMAAPVCGGEPSFWLSELPHAGLCPRQALGFPNYSTHAAAAQRCKGH